MRWVLLDVVRMKGRGCGQQQHIRFHRRFGRTVTPTTVPSRPWAVQIYALSDLNSPVDRAEITVERAEIPVEWAENTVEWAENAGQTLLGGQLRHARRR